MATVAYCVTSSLRCRLAAGDLWGSCGGGLWGPLIGLRRRRPRPGAGGATRLAATRLIQLGAVAVGVIAQRPTLQRETERFVFHSRAVLRSFIWVSVQQFENTPLQATALQPKSYYYYYYYQQNALKLSKVQTLKFCSFLGVFLFTVAVFSN